MGHATTDDSRVLTHVEVSRTAFPIWKEARRLFRVCDVNNMATLDRVEAEKLEPTLAAYTAPVEEGRSHVVFNTALKSLAGVLQASIGVHEGRHVRQIARGSTRPTVKGERDALEYELDFLRPLSTELAAKNRIETIREQLQQLAQQSDDDPPNIVVAKDTDGLRCGCVQVLAPLHIAKVQANLPVDGAWQLLDVGVVEVFKDGRVAMRPLHPLATTLLKTLLTDEPPRRTDGARAFERLCAKFPPDRGDVRLTPMT
jgi:hypothetical protein